jgi:hypothetical protein
MRKMKIHDFKSFVSGFYREISISEYHQHCFETGNGGGFYGGGGLYHMGRRVVPLTDMEKSKISMILNSIEIDNLGPFMMLGDPSISIEMTDKGQGYQNYENGDDLLIQVFITKNDDEYYYVKVVYVDSSDDFSVMEENFYECDQLDGLLKFLKLKFF